jgi:hypothetical protein
LTTKTVSIAILSLLQGEFKADALQDSIENSLVRGLRRAAGLNIINFTLGLAGLDDDTFIDNLQWF